MMQALLVSLAVAAFAQQQGPPMPPEEEAFKGTPRGYVIQSKYDITTYQAVSAYFTSLSHQMRMTHSPDRLLTLTASKIRVSRDSAAWECFLDAVQRINTVATKAIPYEEALALSKDPVAYKRAMSAFQRQHQGRSVRSRVPGGREALRHWRATEGEKSMRAVTFVFLAATLTSSATAANMFRVTIMTNMECWDQTGCGEAFTTSTILALDEEHFGKSHVRTTRGWVCDGYASPDKVDDSQSEPAMPGSVVNGYITISPIYPSAQGLTGLQARATGGVPGVGINFEYTACDAIFCP